jgi:hypothetical protein
MALSNKYRRNSKIAFTTRWSSVGRTSRNSAAGKAACAKSYQDFLNQAKIRNCKLAEPLIDVAGDTAVAACAWEMTYELNGQTYSESGHDLFVFNRDQGKWLAVWRTLLPSR